MKQLSYEHYFLIPLHHSAHHSLLPENPLRKKSSCLKKMALVGPHFSPFLRLSQNAIHQHVSRHIHLSYYTSEVKDSIVAKPNTNLSSPLTSGYLSHYPKLKSPFHMSAIAATSNWSLSLSPYPVDLLNFRIYWPLTYIDVLH